MMGYGGYFVKRLLANPSIGPAATGALFYTTAAGGAAIYPVDATGEDTQAACFFRLDLDVLGSGLGVTLKVQGYNAVPMATTDLVAVGDTVASFNAGASVSKFYRLPVLDSAGSYIKLYFTPTAGAAADAFWEALAKCRVYNYPGWRNVNLTAAACLTSIEPGIVGTALGRAAAASSYAAEIAQAKDLLGSRLQTLGIDLEAIPSDGIVAIGSTSYYPQNIATNLVPELMDPATYLTLALLHERWAQNSEDWDAYRAEYFRGAYEDALAGALKTLPVNLRKDWQQEQGELLRENGSRLVM